MGSRAPTPRGHPREGSSLDTSKRTATRWLRSDSPFPFACVCQAGGCARAGPMWIRVPAQPRGLGSGDRLDLDGDGKWVTRSDRDLHSRSPPRLSRSSWRAGAGLPGDREPVRRCRSQSSRWALIKKMGAAKRRRKGRWSRCLDQALRRRKSSIRGPTISGCSK